MLLIRLLENLTNRKVKKYNGKAPKSEAQKLENLGLAFEFMQSEENIKMIGVGKEIQNILYTCLYIPVAVE